MYRIRYWVVAVVFIAFAACKSKTTFPVSNVVPAAEITVQQDTGDNGNTKFKITAENLASADRIHASNSVYVVWVLSENNGVQNIGQMDIENGAKAVLEATSPYQAREIFITAEKRGNISRPRGKEVARKIL